MMYYLVSLGHYCQVCYHLKRLGLRTKPLLFDWILCEKIESVVSLFENNFVNITQNLSLQKRKYSLGLVVKNTELEIEFFHDFQDGINESSVNTIKQKIENLNFIMHTRPVLFIRMSSFVDCRNEQHLKSHVNQNELENIMRLSKLLLADNVVHKMLLIRDHK